MITGQIVCGLIGITAIVCATIIVIKRSDNE